MNKKTLIWVGLIGIIVVIFVIVGSTSFSNKKQAAKETGPIVIGYIGPLSGEATIYGEAIKRGIDLRIKELNDTGGINGRQIQMISEDGKCEGKFASLAAQKLITVDKVRVILGGQCSNETMSAASIAEENKVLLFTPFSSAPAVTDAGDYVFQLWSSDVVAAGKIVEMMKAQGAEKVALISEQGEYPQGLREALIPLFKEAGLDMVYDESYASDVPDFKSFVIKIQKSGADSVFLNPQTSASGARIAKTLRDQGGEAQFFAYFITDDAFVKSGSAVNGTYLLDFDTVSNKSLGQILLQNYKNQYQKDPEYTTGLTLGYDSAGIVFDAMSHVGYDATKLKDYLYVMKPFNGVTGKITFDKNGGPLGNHNFVIDKIINSTLVKQD